MTGPVEETVNRYSGAYRFRSGLPLQVLAAALAAAGPWTWSLRDGEAEAYLLCHPDGGSTRLRIFGEAPDYVLNATFDPRGTPQPLTFEELHDTILDRVLPGVGATDVGPAPREEE